MNTLNNTIFDNKARNMLIKIGILMMVILFFYSKINTIEAIDSSLLLNEIIELKNINNKLDKDVLLVRSGLMKHYNHIDNDILELDKTFNLLNENAKKLNSKSINEKLINLKEISQIKENIANRLKTKTGVLRNSLMYTSIINNEIAQLLPKEKSDDEHKKLNSDLSSIKHYLIQIITNPNKSIANKISKSNSSLYEHSKKINNKILRDKYTLLYKHINIIVDYSIEVEDNFQHFSDTFFEESLDDIHRYYLAINNNNTKNISFYQNIIYIMIIILVIYSIKLAYTLAIKTRQLHNLSIQLQHQKRAMDDHAIVAIIDKECKISEVNKKFMHVFSHAESDLIGRRFFLLDDKNTNNKFYKEIHNQMLCGKPWRGEIQQQTANNDTIWLDQSIIPFNNKEGDIYQYIAIGTDITSRKKVEYDIEYQAYHDALTKLPNRRLLKELLVKTIFICQKNHHLAALMFLDLDRFKNINDTLGHHTGDCLLISVAEALTSCVDKDSTVARIGGDEFVILIPKINAQLNDLNLKVQQQADKIHDKLKQNFIIEENKIHTSFSIGITIFSGNDYQPSDILKHADIALYKAKEAGRHCTKFFDQSMRSQADRRLLIENDLRASLTNNELVLHIQPQQDYNHKIIGAEVLLRWKHHKNGLISPAEFIPIAEESGIISQIGAWIFETSFLKIKKWCRLNNENGLSHRIAINVSPLQFQQYDFVEMIDKLIDKTGVDPFRIEFEITEGMLVENIDETIEKINTLREKGINFSIDDFGTGYSSLSYLNKLPLSKVKIDQSFVRDIHLNSNNEAIVQTIIYMSTKLNMDVIAEGVETKEELECLYKMGCIQYQGYYFNKPMPIDDFEKLLLES